MTGEEKKREKKYVNQYLETKMIYGMHIKGLYHSWRWNNKSLECILLDNVRARMITILTNAGI